MEVAYNLGDSDSDDENKPTSPLSSPKGKNIKNGITQIEEIQKVRGYQVVAPSIRLLMSSMFTVYLPD